MRINNIETNKPNFKALTIEKQSLPALKERGQEFINKLAETGKEFANYQFFDMKISGIFPKVAIHSKVNDVVYEKLFKAATPYQDYIQISTYFGSGENKGKIGHFSLQFNNTTEAFNAYKEIQPDILHDNISSAIAITKLLEKKAVLDLEKTKQVNTDALLSYIV